MRSQYDRPLTRCVNGMPQIAMAEIILASLQIWSGEIDIGGCSSASAGSPGWHA